MALVVYDGGCGFCITFKRWMERLDWLGRFEWVDLHEADYDDLPVTQDQCVEAMQVVDEGSIYSGFYATRRILRAILLLFPLGLFMYVPGVPLVGRRVYRWVAGRRHCQI